MDKATINQMVQNTIQQHGSKPALSYKVNKQYQDISYTTLGERINHFCLGLTELGMQKGDRVALLSENRPEWAITDLATLAGGGVHCADVFNVDVRAGGVHRQGFGGKDHLCIQRTTVGEDQSL